MTKQKSEDKKGKTDTKAGNSPEKNDTKVQEAPAKSSSSMDPFSMFWGSSAPPIEGKDEEEKDRSKEYESEDDEIDLDSNPQGKSLLSGGELSGLVSVNT